MGHGVHWIMDTANPWLPAASCQLTQALHLKPWAFLFGVDQSLPCPGQPSTCKQAVTGSGQGRVLPSRHRPNGSVAGPGFFYWRSRREFYDFMDVSLYDASVKKRAPIGPGRWGTGQGERSWRYQTAAMCTLALLICKSGA